MTDNVPPGIGLVVSSGGGCGSSICARVAKAGSVAALTYRSNPMARSRPQLPSAPPTATCGPSHSVSIGAGYDIQAHLISEVGPQERRLVTDSDADAFFNTLQAKLLHLRKHSSSYAQSRVRRCDQLIAADILSVAPRHAIQQLIKAHCARPG
jgi:hypothetical protein